jgi:hypothetical protein
MADNPEIKDEIADATEDLRDALHQINNRVEEGVAKLRPDRGIRRHPLTSACFAGALGFALGSDSSEVAIIGLLALGAAIMLRRDQEAGESVASDSDSDEIERV